MLTSFVGIDRHFAYSKRDIKTLIGDQALRKTIQLPKPKLGLCLSLSLETNGKISVKKWFPIFTTFVVLGTVFSGKFLEADKKNAKKFATVYGQRIARSSIPSQCMDCECTASNTGISYMECYLCSMTSMGRTNVEQVSYFDYTMCIKKVVITIEKIPLAGISIVYMSLKKFQRDNNEYIF